MRLQSLRGLVLVSLLLPALLLAWRWRSMPHAGEYHDDAVYFVTAKSLAQTGQLAIESLPGQPAQTKYPPLWPAILSLAWRIEPNYPANLTAAMALCWIWLPLSLLAFRRWLQLMEFTPNESLLLAGVWAINPYVVLFSTTMLSELLFTALLLATLNTLSRHATRYAMLAGALAGAAFLTRTAGVALLPAAIVWFLLRRERKNAMVFAAAMLPSILGWTIWSRGHQSSGADPVALYYTNYFGHYLANIQWSELHVYLWKNIDGVLQGLGSLLLPNTTKSLLDKVLAESLAIAGILGVRRLVGANRLAPVVPYALFAGLYAVILVLWHFPPTERLVLPVAPLWLAGLFVEMKHLSGNIALVFRKPQTSQKLAGAVIAATILFLFASCGLRQWGLLTEGLPRFYADHAARLASSEPAMAWIASHVQPDALFLSENDPLLYLRTGRRGVGLAVIQPTIDWYREDHAARTEHHASAPEVARQYRLEYFLLNSWDFARDMPEEEHAKLMERLRADRRMEKVFEDGTTSLYRVP